MSDIMIDIETLDTRTSTVILSIGWCRFNIKENLVEDSGNLICHIQNQIDSGRTISESTLKWWVSQGTEFNNLISRCNKISLYAALNILSKRITKEDNVWSNGIDFDISILSHAYNKHGLGNPWFHCNVKDYRTIKNLFGNDSNSVEFIGTKHNSEHDAVYQAIHLMLILNSLIQSE